MKYTILGFQQQKLIDNNLTVEDAFILRTIKDMYSSASMEFKEFDGIKYMWINYTYLLEQIPIVGSKRNLMRRIEFYGKECLLLRVLEKERNGVKGNYSYISPTEKLDLLQDFDLMTKSHKVVTKTHKPYDKTDVSLMTKSHNKDTSIKDTSIKDNNIVLSVFKHWNDNKIIVHKKVTKDMEKAYKKAIADYSEEDIKTSITNYSKILKGEEYFFKYKWGLDEFLSRGIKKFLDWDVCSNNFTKEQNKVAAKEIEQKANAGAYRDWSR